MSKIKHLWDNPDYWDGKETKTILDKQGNEVTGYTIYAKHLESIADNRYGVYLEDGGDVIELSTPDWRVGKKGEGRNGTLEGHLIPVYEVGKYYRIRTFICRYIQRENGKKVLEHDPTKWGPGSYN